jgi:PTS system mannose-specific IID component
LKRVSKGALLRMFWRSLFLQASWNPRGMQNLGFAYAMGPALEELYEDPAVRAQATARHLEFFNCHPYMAAAILGGAARVEERVAAGEAEAADVSQFKTTLGPPFAALGDGFFWLALRPAAALAAAVTAPFLGLGCVLVFLGLYNGVHVAARVWMFAAGYARPEGIVETLGHAHYRSGTPLLKACGAALAGAMAARAVLAAAFGPQPLTAIGFGVLIVAAFFFLPRLGVTRSVYIGLFCGLALGARFL